MATYYEPEYEKQVKISDYNQYSSGIGADSTGCDEKKENSKSSDNVLLDLIQNQDSNFSELFRDNKCDYTSDFENSLKLNEEKTNYDESNNIANFKEKFEKDQIQEKYNAY